MSQRFAAPLREIRNTTIPQIPDLALKLGDRPLVIMEVLCSKLVEREIDPDTVPVLDLNKVERGTISGFVGNTMRSFFVEGSGRNSRFRGLEPAVGSFGQYLASVSALQERAAWRTENYYKLGNDLQHQWWPLAEARYEQLGNIASRQGLVFKEGRQLCAALRTSALTSFGGIMLQFIRPRAMALPAEERIKAVHDVMHFMAAPAGMHFTSVVDLGQIMGPGQY